MAENSLSKTRVLFGKKIVSHHMLNYAEQLYDILVVEIESGRWKVGDRLPGVIQLAKELKFGTKTVQTAYDRLKLESYVITRGYRGTYLRDRPLQFGAANEKVGILISEDQVGQPLILWYEHVIIAQARRNKLMTEIRVLPADFDVRTVNERGALFGENVSGIISLTPFRMPVRFGDAPATLPIVFLCPPFENCAPKVCADVRDAYYDLTYRLIRYGHTRIIFSEDSVEPDPLQTKMHREGYLEAMKDYGLPVDKELMKAARSVRNSDPSSVEDYLKAIIRPKISNRPTALVAGSLGRGMVIARVAPLHKINIPRDLSIVTIGCDRLEGQNGGFITGMLPDFDNMVLMCLDMLDQQKTNRKSDITKIHVRMHFLSGDTHYAFNSTVEPNDKNDSNSPLNHNIQTLSQAISC